LAAGKVSETPPPFLRPYVIVEKKQCSSDIHIDYPFLLRSPELIDPSIILSDRNRNVKIEKL